MRKRSTVMIVVLAAMVMVARGQKSPQAPPREFTKLGEHEVRLNRAGDVQDGLGKAGANS